MTTPSHAHLSPRSRARLLWRIIICVLLFGLIGLAWVAFNEVVHKGKHLNPSSYCRQIIIALKSYAGDHDGQFPPGLTANAVFRELIKGQYLADEKVFTSANSPFVGDNDIGSEPDYMKALEANENHWAMTAGLEDKSAPNAPLVFENPLVASWPPKWDVANKDRPVPGRAWRSGMVIVGMNDGSVDAQKLERNEGEPASLERNKITGKNLFDTFSDDGTILQVEKR